MIEQAYSRAAWCFDGSESKGLRDAYVLASKAFSLTHYSTAELEGKLASIVLVIHTVNKLDSSKRGLDVQLLAEESLETLIRFTTAKLRPFDERKDSGVLGLQRT